MERWLRRWRLFLAFMVMPTVAFLAVGTAAADAATFTYDAPAIARVDVHASAVADVESAQLRGSREGFASPAVEAHGASTTSSVVANATEAGETFFRGAKPGDAPSFNPRPNEFKVDAATGTVKPTHGVSVFDNAASVEAKGFVPHEIDMATVSPDLRIIQRGNDLRHFEIVPQVGSNMTPGRFSELLCQIGCKS